MKQLDGGHIGGNSLLYVIIISLTLFSCDATRVLIIDDGKQEKEIDFECGSANISGLFSLGSTYEVTLHISADKGRIQIHENEIDLLYKGEELDYELSWYSSRIKKTSTIDLSKSNVLRMSVNKESVTYGDTLVLRMNGLIECSNGEIPKFVETNIILIGKYRKN
jgi:hypothetical protein